MSATILSGDVTIYYLDENRQKRLAWSGSASGTVTANALYSALQDHFDEVGQMDDGTPMSAQTPVEYTIGIIDAGDLDPWYVSYEMMQHVTGGAVKTNGWTHVDSSATGIITVQVDNAAAVVDGDVGNTISGATDGNGTLLEVIVDGSDKYLVIRPATNAAGDQFTTNDQVITVNGHTCDQNSTASNTGEQIWANLYSLGTIESDTHVYVYQGPAADDATRVRLVDITDSTQDWWSDGHIDMCMYIKDFKTVAHSTIDGGYATVYARKSTTLYDAYEVATSTTSGGRNPIPLSTAPDLDNTTGYRSVTFSGDNYAAGWNVGDEFSGDSSGARGIITQIDSPGSTQTVHYYLVDDPLTDFSADENVTNEDDTGTGDVDGSGPTNQGPALTTWFTSDTLPTTAFANATADIDDDSTDEYYGITVDCNQNPLTEVYEWLKYITRRGATGTTNTDGIPGESYIGGEVYLKYSGSVTSGTVEEGDDVSQATSLATGVVISHDTSNKVLLLRSVRGTFSTSYVVTSTDNSGQFTPNTAAETFAPKKSAPFGTFAGGTFFGARGVLLTDWIQASDENSFILTPIEGGTKSRPVAISIEVTNLVGTSEATTTDDRVAVFRLTGSGGTIDKTEYSATGGETPGGTTIAVSDGPIAVDVPGKTTGGVLRIRDADNDNKNYRIRYASWSTSTFTLANFAFVADGSTDTDTIFYTTGGFTANAKRGDLVLNTTRSNSVSYITQVVSDTQIEISPAIASQTATDNIELNAVPITMAAGDDVYVPLIDQYATTDTASSSIVYSSQIYFRVVVRNSANSTKIIPFTTDDTTSGTDRSIATIRTTDTIIS